MRDGLLKDIIKYLDNQLSVLNRIDKFLPQNEQGQFLSFIPGATGLEEKSDVVHDFLDYLATRMMEVNKEKQAEEEHFQTG